VQRCQRWKVTTKEGARLLVTSELVLVSSPSRADVLAFEDGADRGSIIAQPVAGLPAAAYADVAPRADDDVWFAAGLSSSIDDARAWPGGEGMLVWFDGRTFIRHRAPDGALLAVAAPAPAEAWAVGLAGGVVHARGGTMDAFHLVAEDGTRLQVTLRAAAAAGVEDVWIAGDLSTLLHWDGKSLLRIDASGAGRDATFTAVIAPSAAPGWVVGSSGIWRLARARPP
jgi:hypothetical protein